MKIDKILILAFVIFSLLTIPFITSVPYLDGNVDFVKSYDFFVGGFGQLLNNWLSIHPPVKEVLTFISFVLGGVSSIAYNITGILLGLFGIVIFYKLCRLWTNKAITCMAVLLFCSSPLFLSAGLFSLTDYLLEIFILASLYFYSKQKFNYYFLFTSLALLTKETALVFVIGILAIEGSSLVKNIRDKNKNYKRIIGNILRTSSPLITIIIWFVFLKLHGEGVWSDWNFSETSQRGTAYTIFNNLFFFKMFNKYAIQNWLQFFVLNFNWLLWVIILIGTTIKIAEINKEKEHLNKLINKIFTNKSLVGAFIFCIAYFISVLSFQTYTIPRYALPLEPFFYLAVAFGSYQIYKRSKILKVPLYTFLCGITIVRLFTSIDPISTHFWGKSKILGQSIYALNQAPSLTGFDGITYNLQYNLIVKKRSDLILGKTRGLSDCSWIFPDPNNDLKTVEILNIKNINPNFPCLD